VQPHGGSGHDGGGNARETDPVLAMSGVEVAGAVPDGAHGLPDAAREQDPEPDEDTNERAAEPDG
jgi:hypothetical protein